jgi:integrase
MASIANRGEYQWQVQIRRKGHVLSKTFFYKKDAEAWARKVESEIDRGIFINTNEAERMTLSALIERYKNEELPKLKSQTQEISRLNIIEKMLGKEIIGAITSSSITKFCNERLKLIKQNSVNREVTSIKRLLSFAHNDCKITLPNGLPEYKKKQVDDSRVRRVSDAEIEVICNHSESAELANIIKIAVLTAMRRSEITNLKRGNIDFSVPCLKLLETKNGKNHIAPLSNSAAAILRKQTPRVDGFVFGLRGRSITQAFNRARVRARNSYLKKCKENNTNPDENFLVDLRFHDLRHEATSRLAALLPNVIELSRVTGHKDLKMLSLLNCIEY